MVILRERREVVSCLKRSDAFGFAGLPEGFALTGAELQDPDGGLLRCDDPKFGRAIRPIFSARRVERSRSGVRAVADGLVAAIEPDARGVVDFKWFSRAFVAHAVCLALGVSLTSWEFVLSASRSAFGVIESEAQVAEAQRVWRDLYAFFGKVVETKRADPDDAIISDVIRAFDARGFSDRQAVRTVATISNGFPAALPVLDVSMVELLERREVVDACLRAPGQWRDVVGECMRHRAMFPVALPRRATRDTKLGERFIPAGTVVLPSLLAAAHDPANAVDPDEFVVGRERAVGNIVFGGGSHFCPGAAHTGLWLEVSLQAFFERFPRARLTEPSSLQWEPGTLSTPKAINVQVTSDARTRRPARRTVKVLEFHCRTVPPPAHRRAVRRRGDRVSTTVRAAADLAAHATVEALAEARARTLGLVASVCDEDLERVHSPLMSPLVWDLAHIGAFEDLWLVHRYAGQALTREDLAELYDAFETPRANRGHLPLLGPAAAREYLGEVRERTVAVIEQHGIGDGSVHEMVLRHEQQHGETMLQTIQLARLAGYEPVGARDRAPNPPVPALTGLELIEIGAGPCEIGAPRLSRFAYDNERPRHRTDLRRYRIGRTPITNQTYRAFVEGGGYEDREWWSDEGWVWRDRHDITGPMAWTADHAGEWRLGSLEPLHPDRPVVHVSWFEADAFARAHGARLPTETEWEKAATWDPDSQQALRNPWGDMGGHVTPGVHANVDHVQAGPAPAGAYPAGASPSGCLGMIGDVWEWTATNFHGYPGFVANPYKEYSEVFFGTAYKVLRGGSWATRARVITPTFRNWDHPQRRQIFSGLRIAKDA